MKNKEKTREKLLGELKILREQMKEFKKSESERKKVDKVLTETKEQLEAQTWGLKKTNETIRLLYKELEDKNKELQKLDQLKSDFVSTVSHELRTPLAITKEGISLVLDEVPGKVNDKQKKILGMSRDNIDRLASIINDLLDISKIEAGKVELKKSLVDISSIVSEVCNRWKTESNRKGQEIKVSLPKSVVNIYVDTDKIIQVLNNLISNAIKYTPDKGKIEVELIDKKDKVDISVSDTGIGIAKEDLPKVFGKFQQFGRTPGPGAKGTGLGLTICKQLVEMHKGTIGLESKFDQGTKFTFSLPKMDFETILKEQINNGINDATEKNSHLSIISVRISGLDELKKKSGLVRCGIVVNDIEKAIRDSLYRRSDIVIKGSEEFAVFLFDASKDNVAVVKKRIGHVIDGYLSKGKGKDKWFQNISITVGCATYPEEASSDEELLSKARVISRRKG